MGLLRRGAKRLLKVVMERGSHVPAAAPSSTAPSIREPSREPEPAQPDLSNIECGAQELKERLDAGEHVTVLDVREPHETAGGVIPGAIAIPLGRLENGWNVLEDADEVVCYCALGARSLQAAAFLRSKGLFNATSMDGGIVAWQDIGGALGPLQD